MSDQADNFDINEAIEKFSAEMHIDAETYKKILSSTVTTTEADLPNLEQAIKDGDFETIQSLAHRIKGTLLNMRLEQIAAPMVEIDALSKSKEGLESMQDYFTQFTSLFEQLKNALN